jgi:tetratricopeptide (TPR) repeat protein
MHAYRRYYPSPRLPRWWRCAALMLLSCAPLAMVWAGTPPPDQPFRAPYLPTRDGEVLQQVPAPSDPMVRDMRRLRTALDAAPRDLAAANRLATAYIDFGRQLGDAHYAGYAEAVIAPWLAQTPPPVQTLVLYATILQYRHQFKEARAQLALALARDGKNSQALLTLATLDMVQGDYEAASKGCSRLATASGYEFGIVCSAALRTYIGQAQQSLQLLQVVARNMAKEPAPVKAWLEGLQAEGSERLGDWPQAEQHYRKALSYTPEDNFLLVAYADFLLDRQRPAEVLPLLAGHEQSDTAFLRIALAQGALGSPDLPRYVWIMAARFEALMQRGSDFFGREQVRFALNLQHDPAAALELAQQNWAVQREPWDTRVYLEAALAAGQPAAAVPVIDFVDKNKLQDPLIEALVRQLRSAPAKAAGSLK